MVISPIFNASPDTTGTGNDKGDSAIFTLLTPQDSRVNYPPARPVEVLNKTGDINKSEKHISSFPNQTTIPEPLIQPDMSLILTSGWNFVSTPRSLREGNNTVAIFNKIDSRGHSMYRYESSSGWITVRNTDIFTPLEGFWIFSAFPSSIPLFFKDDLLITPESRTLQSGWNAIGIAGTTPQTMNQTLQSITDKWLFLISFNSTTQSNNNPLIKGWKDISGVRYTLEPGKGYWIYMTTPGVMGSSPTVKDIPFSGTVDYKVSEQGWTFTLPGTISGVLSPETGKLQIFSSDAIIKYGGNSYPISMDIDAIINK